MPKTKNDLYYEYKYRKYKEKYLQHLEYQYRYGGAVARQGVEAARERAAAAGRGVRTAAAAAGRGASRLVGSLWRKLDRKMANSDNQFVKGLSTEGNIIKQEEKNLQKLKDNLLLQEALTFKDPIVKEDDTQGDANTAVIDIGEFLNTPFQDIPTLFKKVHDKKELEKSITKIDELDLGNKELKSAHENAIMQVQTSITDLKNAIKGKITTLTELKTRIKSLADNVILALKKPEAETDTAAYSGFPPASRDRLVAALVKSEKIQESNKRKVLSRLQKMTGECLMVILEIIKALRDALKISGQLSEAEQKENNDLIFGLEEEVKLHQQENPTDLQRIKNNVRAAGRAGVARVRDRLAGRGPGSPTAMAQ